MEFLNYLLKVSACSALFFGFYLLVLRRLTFFKINRFYLLITLLLSFIIPTLHFHLERQIEVQQPTEIIAPATSQIELTPVFGGPTMIAEIGLPIQKPFDWLVLLPYSYGLVVISLLCVAIWRLVLLLKHARKNIHEVNGLKLVYKSAGFTNCSFFNYVFIDEKNLTKYELQVLLAHEEIHAKQFHSIDKIILMIAKAVLWFNPIVYFYDKALEQTHEFEADEATSQNFGTESYANLLLRSAIAKSEMPLVHNFVKSPIKERIKMLFNSKTKDMKKLIYLLALPIGLGLLWGFTVDVVEVSVRNSDIRENAFFNINQFSQEDTSKMAKIEKIIQPLLNQTIVGKVVGFGNDIPSLPTILILSNGITYPIHNPFSNNRSSKLPSHKFQVGETVKIKILKSYALSPKFDYYVIMPELIFDSSDKKLYTRPAQPTKQQIATNRKAFSAWRVSPEYQQQAKLAKEISGKTKTGTVGEVYDNGKNVFAKGVLFRVADKTYILDSGFGKYDISKLVAKNDVLTIKVGVSAFNKDAPHLVLSAQTLNKNGKLIYTRPPVEQTAFGFEANRARYANSKIKAIQKNSDGTIGRIVLNDKGFTINLNIADQKFKSKEFKVGDSVVVKFFGEKLIDKNTYSTDRMIVLYSWPKKYELKNEKLFDKFYFKDGRQKVAETTAKIDKVDNDDVKVSPYIVNKPKEIPLSDAYILLANLKNGNDSLKSYTVMENSLFVKGNIKLNIDGFLLVAKFINVDKYSNLITAHLATLSSPDGSSLTGDEIVFDVTKKLAKTTKPKGYYKSN